MDAFDDEIHRRHALGGMAHEMGKVLRLAHAHRSSAVMAGLRLSGDV